MIFSFGGFTLDLADRRLRDADGAPVELNARYFDALALLVREAGRLVPKERFLEEVWRGVPVTDEALTQCIKTLRRQLGDDAARPRFIETVPKHGYRFVAAVTRVEGAAAETQPPPDSWRRTLLIGGAGTLGAGAAGLIGGLAYGLAAAEPLGRGAGAVSAVILLIWLTLVVALIGGAGVSFGIAAGSGRRGIAGGALGGMIVGALAKLLGLDAFTLLLGRSPGDITGGMEGLLLGAAVGLGAWLAGRGPRPFALRRGAVVAGLAGASAGLLIPLLGGRMMGGSLDLLARTFPDSRLPIGAIGGLFGEEGFGPVSQAVTGAVEGMLFGACLVGAMILGGRSLGSAAEKSA